MLAGLLVAYQAHAATLDVLTPKEQVILLIQEQAKEVAVPLETILEIARCESGIRQFDQYGKVIQSHTNDFGVFQINAFYHQETARKMGLDIMKTEDNIKYAAHLMKLNGTRDWNASKHCWNK